MITFLTWERFGFDDTLREFNFLVSLCCLVIVVKCLVLSNNGYSNLICFFFLSLFYLLSSHSLTFAFGIGFALL